MHFISRPEGFTVGTLQSSKLRVDRANKKLTALERKIQRARGAAFKMAAEQADFNAPDPLFKFMWQLRDETRLLTSEFALHARTALDYVVFALALCDTGSEQKGTQFPINECPEDFARNRTGCLKHLTGEHVAMIENFQPYKGFRLRPLSILHRLSNRDEHREFACITFGGMRWQDPILQTSPPSVGITHMEVNVGRTFEILLFEGGPEIEDLEKALANIFSQVREIVDYFDGVLG
jgi:hypothetical protein